MYLIYERFNNTPSLKFDETVTLFAEKEDAEKYYSNAITGYIDSYSDEDFMALLEENSYEFDMFCETQGLDHNSLDANMVKNILPKLNHLFSADYKDFFEIRFVDYVTFGKTLWLSE